MMEKFTHFSFNKHQEDWHKDELEVVLALEELTVCGEAQKDTLSNE